jgi:hypothetical protein
MSGPSYTASFSQDPAPSVPFVLPDGSEIALQITTDSSTRSDSNEESDFGSDSGSEPGLHDSSERLLELPECTGVLVQ